MKVVKPDTLSMLTRVLVEKDSCLLSVGALALFTLESACCVLDEAYLWDCVNSALGENDLFDAGVPKPRGEFLVYGDCYDHRLKGYAKVSVRVGKASKQLDVFGDRFWHGDTYAPSKRFASIPVDWEHAYGGEDFEANPLGKGYGKGDGRALPNVLIADEIMKDADHILAPAGLRAYPEMWPQRAQFQGTYDNAWLESHWPGRPEDFNPEHACVAPPDQRIKKYFNGDELIEISGMHEDGDVVRGALPGLRARMFVLRNDATGETFHEVTTRLDTVWLFPGQERGVVLFRGVTRTSDEECGDLDALLAEFEPMDGPSQSEEFYRSRLNQALGREEKIELALPEPEPESESEAAPTLFKSVPVAAAASAMDLAPMKKLVAEIEENTSKHLETLGVSKTEVENFITEKQQEAAEFLAPQDESAAQSLERELHAKLEEYGVRPEDVNAFVEKNSKAADNIADPAEVERELRGYLETNPEIPAESRAKIQEVIAGFSQLALVQKQLKAFVGKEEAIPEKKTAFEPETEPKEPGPVFERLTREEVLKRHSEGQSLAGTDLSELDLSGADLQGIDLREAVLVNTNFSEAKLHAAQFIEADCTGADFLKALLESANFSGALCEDAHFVDTQARGMTAVGARFNKADCTRMDARGGALQNADFTEALMDQADLSCVQGEGLRLNGVRGHGLNISKANLINARADEQSELPELKATEADLRGVTWIGAKLTNADLLKARLDGANLSKVDALGADFFRATAINAVFAKASLANAKLIGVNLFGASLRRADLSGAVIENVNMYGADLFHCRINVDAMNDVNVKCTVLAPEGLK